MLAFKDTPLYADIPLLDQGKWETQDGHRLHWELWGNANGIPAVFLHGGPGSGSSAWHKAIFDPQKYKVLIFDQRGSGQSTPHATLQNNTTAHLIQDLEDLRRLLNIEKWAVAGGSWGSTLALAYADQYAKHISALIIYGVFLARESELRNFYYSGGVAHKIFPEVFSDYLSVLPEEDKKNPLEGYRKLFTSNDQKLKLQALNAWTRLEKRLSRLQVSAEEMNLEMENPEYVLAHSLLENHYFLHHGFIHGDQILEGIGKKLKNIPVHIIQGRYDMVCPMITAYELHHAIPHSHLHIIEESGHSGREPGIQEKLVEVIDCLAKGDIP